MSRVTSYFQNKELNHKKYYYRFFADILKMKITKTVLLAVAIQYLHVVTGFPTGPPRTDFVCKDMFPVGHGYDAQFTEPPYSIKLSQNVYTPWEELRGR